MSTKFKHFVSLKQRETKTWRFLVSKNDFTSTKDNYDGSLAGVGMNHQKEGRTYELMINVLEEEVKAYAS